MTNLKSANIGLNKYCGPAVLSILTGKSTDECAAVISRINGKHEVTGVYLSHLLQAAHRLGFDNRSIQPAGTLYSTIVRLATTDGVYIVSVPGHFVVIEVNQGKVYFCDNHTKEPMPAASSARMLQKVEAVNLVYKRPDPKVISDIKRVQIIVTREVKYDDPLFNRSTVIGNQSFDNWADAEHFLSQIEDFK